MLISPRCVTSASGVACGVGGSITALEFLHCSTCCQEHTTRRLSAGSETRTRGAKGAKHREILYKTYYCTLQVLQNQLINPTDEPASHQFPSTRHKSLLFHLFIKPSPIPQSLLKLHRVQPVSGPPQDRLHPLPQSAHAHCDRYLVVHKCQLQSTTSRLEFVRYSNQVQRSRK